MKYKTNNFPHNKAKALDLCKEYSSDPSILESLLDRLNIKVQRLRVIPGKWDKKLKSLLYSVTVEGFTFNYYGSHHDAELIESIQDPECRQRRCNVRKLKNMNDGVLYDILCSIGCDYSICESDPEDLGMNPDSIKDMASWNEIKEHSKQLRSALKLSDAEVESLPS